MESDTFKDDFLKTYRADRRSTEELFDDASAAAMHKDSEDDALSEKYWGAVRVLHARADDVVMNASKELLSSKSTVDRVLACDILAQVYLGNEVRRTEAVDLLLPLFKTEFDVDVLKSISIAFGHLRDSRAVPRLVELSFNSDASLRYAVVFGLSCEENEQAIDCLIRLSSDPDEDVRKWATFGLGSQVDVDTQGIRDALLARMSESNDEVRGEAFLGLARRGDVRVIPWMIKELDALDPEILRDWVLVTDAAKEVVSHPDVTGSSEWLPLLRKLEELEIGDPDELRAAIKRCTQSG